MFFSESEDTDEYLISENNTSGNNNKSSNSQEQALGVTAEDILTDLESYEICNDEIQNDARSLTPLFTTCKRVVVEKCCVIEDTIIDGYDICMFFK